MKKHLIRFLTPICFISLFLYACNNSNKKNITPEFYDLNNPEIFIMPDKLFEISGICFDKGSPDTLFSIQDEDGKLFSTVLGKKDVTQIKFGKKGDYEDVAVTNEKVYVLRSDGTLFSFKKPTFEQQSIDSLKEWKALLPEGEYEGMYGHDASDKLYILCKECKTDDLK
ncbi:MAG: hypothetical protein IPO92_08900 [Saprospiraceae bacterium]|nr:hypothetical protein [Saprospiraceae bacterium]